jgi:hypothetical protein
MMGRKMEGDDHPLAQRAADLKRMVPHFVANLTLYTTTDGGRANPILPGFGCPCMLQKERPLKGFDCWPLLGDDPIAPGETREVGFFFLVTESAEEVRQAGRFYLWDRDFFAEAEVLPG